jgi:hypothetical protein
MSSPVLCSCGQNATNVIIRATEPVRPACGECASAAPYYCLVRRLEGTRRGGRQHGFPARDAGDDK